MGERRLAQSIVSIFLGASWAIIALFGLLSYKLFASQPPMVAISATIVGIMVSLLIILIFEIISLQFENSKEIKKQTSLLKEIKDRLDMQSQDNQTLPHN
jgi:hypothetical protein